MAVVTYTYDSASDGNYGKGRRTGMSDGSGTMAYKYDRWGRVIEEKRTVDSVTHTTTIAYDGAIRMTSVIYPTGEVATQAYNGRGLPYSLGSSVNGTIVASMQYNALALPTQIDLGNNTRTIYGYWDMGGSYDTTGGYYGKLWEIKTVQTAGGQNTLQEMKHTWDAAGNLTIRENVKDNETESFSYDHLERLLSVSGAYSESYAYNQLGNMTSKGGQSYTYSPSKPHAVTSVGSTNYIYDANGNMTTRGAASLTWDAENRLTGVTGSASYVYDGDGFRVKKIEGGATIAYINQYYEKNLTTATVTLYYYLGDKMMAYKEGATLTYIHQDHLTASSVISDSSGNSIGAISYKPYGETRAMSGTLPEQKFTGQRLDDVGLYYYGGRYYDPALARFVSADSFVSGKTAGNSIVPALQVNLALSLAALPKKAPFNPQILNRYSYVMNNPLRFIDPTGMGSQNALDPGIVTGSVGNDDLARQFGWQGGNSSDDGSSSEPEIVVEEVKTPATLPKDDAKNIANTDSTSNRKLSTNPSEKSSLPQDVTPAVKQLSTKQDNECGTNHVKQSSVGDTIPVSEQLQGIAEGLGEALNKSSGPILIIGGLVLIPLTVTSAPLLGLWPAIPAIYAELGFITQGVNRTFGTDINLPPVFGPWRGNWGLRQ